MPATVSRRLSILITRAAPRSPPKSSFRMSYISIFLIEDVLNMAYGSIH